MAICMSISINQAVGAGASARNDAADVRAVQEQLNGHMGPSREPLEPDGKCGSLTNGAIRSFQSEVLGFGHPDGRVDPGGKTLRALNDPTSTAKWARMSVAPTVRPKPPRPSGLPASGPGRPKTPVPMPNAMSRELRGNSHLREEIAKLPAKDEVGELYDVLIKDYFPAIKPMLATISNGQEAHRIALGFEKLIKAGWSAKGAAQTLGTAFRYKPAGAVVNGLDELAKSSTMGRVLGKLGKGVFVLALFITAIEVRRHWMKGHYGAAAGEIYKTGMAAFIPWAGLLDGVQAMLEGFEPSLKNSPVMRWTFDVLRSVNPLGAGAVGVDSIVTIIDTMASGILRGEWNTRQLDALVERMHASPLQVFARIGEGLGDWLYDALN